MSEITDRSKLRILEFTEEGTFLTVFPPAEGTSALVLTEVLAELATRQVIGFSEIELQKVLRDLRGEPTLIAPAQTNVITEPMIKVKFCKNKMEAYLSIFPSIEGTPVGQQQIQETLVANGVSYGILDEAIQVACDQQFTVEPLLIAQGLAPLPGVNAVIDFKCRCLINSGKPLELEDGRVDYHNLNLIRNVQVGEILAIKTPATEGVVGYTVLGEELTPKHGKDVRIIAGKNVQLINGECIAVASVRGHAIVVGNKLSVSPVYEVKGDVNLSTGNICFNGNVIIRGSVTEGFSVQAEGDVEIDNLICEGNVECEGNLKVRNGIIGKRVSTISAGGSIFTKFIENAQIKAGMDVVVGEVIMHSIVNSKNDVTVGGKGVIIGGLIRAGGNIRCKVAGSASANAELEAGVNPELRAEYARLLNMRREKENEYDKVDKALQMLNRMKATGTPMHPDKIGMLLQLTKLQGRLAGELDSLNERIKGLEEKMKVLDQGRIWVQEKLHAGVKVTLGGISKYVQEDASFVCLSNSAEEIKMSPYR